MAWIDATLVVRWRLLVHAMDALHLGAAVVWRSDLTYAAVNDRLARMNGLPAAEHQGRAVPDVVPQSWPDLAPIYDRVFAGEEVTIDWDGGAVGSAVGTAVGTAVGRFLPLREGSDGGEVVALLVTVEDVTAERRLRRSLQEQLALAEALGRQRDIEGVTAAASAAAGAALGTAGGVLSIVEDRTDRTVSVGLGAVDGRLVPHFSELPLTADTPGGEVILTGTALWLGPPETWSDRWPTVAPHAHQVGLRSLAVLPLVVGGRVIGCWSVHWDSDVELDDADRQWLRAAAGQVGQAAGRARSVRRERRATETAERLLDLSTVLNTARTPAEVANAVTDAAVRLSDAVEAGIYRLEPDGSQVRLAVAGSVNPRDQPRYDTIPAGAALPVVTAAELRTPLWLEKPSDWTDYPEMMRAVERLQWVACAVLPLVWRSECFGTLFVTFPPGRHLLDEERRYLAILAELCTAALQRVLTSATEEQARVALAATQARLQLLSEFGVIGVLRADAERITYANNAMLELLGRDSLPDGGLDWRAITPDRWREADDRALAQLRDQRWSPSYEKEYLRADGVAVPVLMSVATAGTDPFEATAAVMDLTALKVAQAGERRAHEERERLSHALQSALLPTIALPAGPLRLSVGYRPGDHRLTLGGDFYDAIALPGGGTAVLVGDVSGHGPQAAAVGAALRITWRAVMLSGGCLADVPARLHDVLLSERDDDTLFATVITGVVADDARSIELISAGHPGPVLVNAHGARPLALPRLPLLGVLDPEPPVVHREPLQPGDRVILFTDGLIEGLARPAGDQRLGDEGLVAVLDAAPHLAQDASALIDEINTLHGGDLPDDVALLIVHAAE